MSMQKKLKVRGILMLISFFVVLGVIFSPVFPGKWDNPGKVNGLDFIDNVFNRISKGSSYFIPKALKDSEKFAGKKIEVKIKAENEQVAAQTAKLFEAGGAQVVVTGKELAIHGDMGLILKRSLSDADFMYKNDGKSLAEKYGFSEQQALYNWWMAFKEVGSDLTNQKKFKEAKEFATIQKKALEPAYNYYGIMAKDWQENITLIIAALAFYVFYTLWYGFGIMYLFEGLGLKIGH